MHLAADRRCRLQVLARTLRVDYRIPSKPRVSHEAAHLLSNLLVLDPNKRLTTAGVMQHPWFRQGLPRGVDTLNQRCLQMKVLCDALSQTSMPCTQRKHLRASTAASS